MEKREKKQVKNKKGGLRAQSQKIKASLLKSYYGNPTKDMKLVAITGTTGKTTVAHYVHEILKATGEQVAVFASDQPYKLGTKECLGSLVCQLILQTGMLTALLQWSLSVLTVVGVHVVLN